MIKVSALAESYYVSQRGKEIRGNLRGCEGVVHFIPLVLSDGGYIVAAQEIATNLVCRAAS